MAEEKKGKPLIHDAGRQGQPQPRGQAPQGQAAEARPPDRAAGQRSGRGHDRAGPRDPLTDAARVTRAALRGAPGAAWAQPRGR